ncbi:MAG: hypothetical protein GQ527_04015 [Bacteroidales bacterium]|nr:hypothetical protein [Bacteroidales bacterium]
MKPCRITILISLFFIILIGWANTPNQQKKLSLSKKTTKLEYASINLQIAKDYFRDFSYDSAVIYSSIAVAEFEKLNAVDQLIESLQAHYRILQKLSFNSRLLPVQRQLIKLLLQNNDSSKLMVAYDRMGIAFYHMNITDSAIFYYQKSYKIGVLMNNSKALINSYNNLSQVYRIYGDYNKELEYCKSGLDLAQADNNTRDMGVFYHNIALAYIHLNRFDSAMVNVLKAIENNIQIQELDHIALNKTALGNIYAMQGDVPKAMDYFQEVLTYHTKVGNLHGQTEDNYNLGFSYYYLGDYNLAEKYSFEALRISKMILLTEYESDVYELLSDIYSGQNDYQKALTYYHKFKSLSDSIKETTNLAVISQFQSEYEYEKNTNKIMLLSKEYELQEKQYKDSIIFAVITSVSLVILGFLLFFLFRKLRKNQDLTTQLKTQNIAIQDSNHTLGKLENKTQNDIKYANQLQLSFFDHTALFTKNFKNSFFDAYTQKPVKDSFLWTNKLGNKLYWAIITIGQDRIKGAFTSMYLYNMLNKIYYDRNFSGVDSFTQTFIQEAFTQKTHHQNLGKAQMCFCSYDMKKNELDFINIGIAIELIRNAKVWDFKWSQEAISLENTEPIIPHKIQLQEGDKLIIFNKNWNTNKTSPIISAGKNICKEQETVTNLNIDYSSFIKSLKDDPRIEEYVFLSLDK